MLAVMPIETHRRAAEPAMVKHFNRLPGNVSYEFLDKDLLKDKNKAKERVAGLGFDSAVVIKAIGTRSDLRSNPRLESGYVRSGFWGFYSYEIPLDYQSTDYEVKTVFAVEISLYSIKDDQILWTSFGEVDTSNNVDSGIALLAAAAQKDWQARGLLK